MRFLFSERIIRHMARRKSVNFKMFWKKYKQKTTKLKRIYWKYLKSYRKRIRMMRSFGNRRIGICGIY